MTDLNNRQQWVNSYSIRTNPSKCIMLTVTLPEEIKALSPTISALDRASLLPPIRDRDSSARVRTRRITHTQSLGGVTTRYCHRSTSDLESELLELQHKTKVALEASWEEVRRVKLQMECRRDVVACHERELEIKTPRRLNGWVSLCVPALKKRTSTLEAAMWQNAPGLSVRRLVSDSWSCQRDRRQQEHLQGHRSSIINRIVGVLGLKLSMCQTRHLNAKLRSLRQNHDVLVSSLKIELHQKDSNVVALQRDVADRNAYILRLQKDCGLIGDLRCREYHKKRKEREDHMMKIVILLERIRTSENQ